MAVYCRLQSHDFWAGGRDRIAGSELNGFVMPKFWKGDYWENLPKLNKWFKANKPILDKYDSGQLSKGL